MRKVERLQTAMRIIKIIWLRRNREKKEEQRKLQVAYKRLDALILQIQSEFNHYS